MQSLCNSNTLCAGVAQCLHKYNMVVIKSCDNIIFKKMSKRLFPFLMWAYTTFFFTYQFILRLWPSLTMQQIMQQFAIDATSYGLLASVYYYGYSGFQIPIAIAMDKYGPRIILSLCALLCGIGMYLSIETMVEYCITWKIPS